MINVTSLQQFKEVFNKEGQFCLIFGREQSPTCLVMMRVLKEVCRKRDYKCLYLDVSVQKFYKLVKKYSVGILPKYVFVNENSIVYEGVGTESKRSIEKGLKETEA